MIMLFPLSLSGAAHRWFTSLDSSRHGMIWDKSVSDSILFNAIVDVSRRELKALRQRPNESFTSFISRWREKIE